MKSWSVPITSITFPSALVPMISALLDSNIYDELSEDEKTRELIQGLVAKEALQVIVTRTIATELQDSPFKGVPKFFPYKLVGNTVARAGIMCAGDSLGEGQVYDHHRGNSNKHNDAFIADAASWHADWLVSEDTRLRKRLDEQQVRCKSLSYPEFINALTELAKNTFAKL